MLVSKPDWEIICGLWNRNACEEMRRNQVGSPRNKNKIVCGLQSLMIGVTTWLGRKSPSAARRNSTSKTLLYFSSQPDGSPDYVTSVSVSEPAMHLPPVYVDGQIHLATRAAAIT